MVIGFHEPTRDQHWLKKKKRNKGYGKAEYIAHGFQNSQPYQRQNSHNEESRKSLHVKYTKVCVCARMHSIMCTLLAGMTMDASPFSAENHHDCYRTGLRSLTLFRTKGPHWQLASLSKVRAETGLSQTASCWAQGRQGGLKSDWGFLAWAPAQYTENALAPTLSDKVKNIFLQMSLKKT